MSYSLVVHHEAYRELNEAERYIEARRAGYGRKFRDQVDVCLTFIQAKPKGYARRRGEFRYGMVARFPYRVIYRVEGDVIFVGVSWQAQAHGWMDRRM